MDPNLNDQMRELSGQQVHDTAGNHASVCVVQIEPKQKADAAPSEDTRLALMNAAESAARSATVARGIVGIAAAFSKYAAAASRSAEATLDACDASVKAATNAHEAAKLAVLEAEIGVREADDLFAAVQGFNDHAGP